jgi:hypothetical protein
MMRASIWRDGELVGVAFLGRPSARLLDDGRTAEITRVAVIEGVPNGCSMLLGALRRAAAALGYLRIITYTLEHEPGVSERAAGFRREAVTRGGSWDRAGRERGAADLFGETPRQELGPKVRWVWGRPIPLTAEQRADLDP